MSAATFQYAYRIIGPVTGDRRLVDAAAAFIGYAGCDERARVDSEAYLSAFQFGPDFPEYLRANGTTKGFNGLCGARFLWWDIDADDNLEAARRDAAKLALACCERFALSESKLLAFFSGSKGFHVGVPTGQWEPSPSADFHQIARRFCETVAEGAGVTIDAGVYDKVRAFRAPNSRHAKTGLHKRALTVEQLMHLSADAIRKLAERPEPFDIPAAVPTDGDWNAAALWNTAAEQVRKQAEAAGQHRASVAAGEGVPTLNRLTLEFIRAGAGTGDRHRLLYSAARNLAEFGCTPTLAAALLHESALDSGLSPSDVKRQMECGLKDGGGQVSKANYISADDALEAWRDDVMSGKPPTLYPVGTGEQWERVEIGPGLVTLIGGAPGSGKTGLVMQLVVEALRLTPTLRALVCNVEMPPGILLDRQLARLSGVNATTIRYRRLGEEHAERIDAGIATLASVADRLAFTRAPFDLANVAESADEFNAGLIVLDYIQRIAPPGEHESRRNSVDAMMSFLRQFADAGRAIIVVSAVGRSKDSRGRSSYDGGGLSLASFRESSELEFGADDAWILHPDVDDAEGEAVKLRHLKSRHGECRDLAMRFDRAHQSFTPIADPLAAGDGKALAAAIAAAWDRANPAADDDTEGGDDE
jgi:replicative DNA helicase